MFLFAARKLKWRISADTEFGPPPESPAACTEVANIEKGDGVLAVI